MNLPTAAALLLLTTLSGCTSLPEVGDGDCQLRAGAALGEGQASMFGGGNFTGGAVTLINPEACDPQTLRVLTRYGTTLVCMGSDAWCEAAIRGE